MKDFHFNYINDMSINKLTNKFFRYIDILKSKWINMFNFLLIDSIIVVQQYSDILCFLDEKPNFIAYHKFTTNCLSNQMDWAINSDISLYHKTIWWTCQAYCMCWCTTTFPILYPNWILHKGNQSIRVLIFSGKFPIAQLGVSNCSSLLTMHQLIITPYLEIGDSLVKSMLKASQNSQGLNGSQALHILFTDTCYH